MMYIKIAYVATHMLLLLFYVLLSNQFKIKHADRESFICVGKSGFKNVLMECKDRSLATEFRTEFVKEGLSYIYPLGKSKVWDAINNLIIEIKTKKARQNQLYGIVYIGPDTYMIIGQQMCLTFESQNYILKKCDNIPEQLFTIVYNEIEVNAMTETKNISSQDSPVDSKLEKLQRMIDGNKVLAEHIARIHNNIAKKHSRHKASGVIETLNNMPY